jgi:hypothetical protein
MTGREASSLNYFGWCGRADGLSREKRPGVYGCLAFLSVALSTSSPPN